MGKPSTLRQVLDEWLESCRRHGRISRNTVAVGIVILDHLRAKCPIEPPEILSSGGEISGSRAGLARTLEKYGIPQKYLKEATTRQVHQDGQRLLTKLDYGKVLLPLSSERRDAALTAAIGKLVEHAQEWLARQHLKVNCDRQLSPAAWVGSILDEAKGRSGGKVEQHLVGAKLEERFPEISIPNKPAHAGDVQTGRQGDFQVGSTCYHVTATPSRGVIARCRANLKVGLHPVLLAPRAELTRAVHLAEDEHVDKRVTILAIEDFVTLNIIELSRGDQGEFLAVLTHIVEKYNRRLEAVETDLSLIIELQ